MAEPQKPPYHQLKNGTQTPSHPVVAPDAPPYNPREWDKPPPLPEFKQSPNCYDYMMNNKGTVRTQQELTRSRVWESNDPADRDAFMNAVNRQAQSNGAILAGKTKPKEQKAGYYLGAFVSSPPSAHSEQQGGFGYHFLRQNPDGTWSQKDGTLPVTNKDERGQVITDPEKMHYKHYKVEEYYWIPKGGLAAKSEQNAPAVTKPATTTPPPAPPKKLHVPGAGA